MVPFPRMMAVRQRFPDRRIADVAAATAGELAAWNFEQRARPGARIAIGVGSRGIANIAAIVRSVVDYWKARGADPFIFPAMGSHGAATALGQTDVLAHYGIHEATVGCPIVSSLEVVSLGTTPDGIEAFLDRSAFESDGIFLINRIKWHTDFAGTIESGLFKMMAIGLGKFAGAQRYHTYAVQRGLEAVIRAVGRKVLATGKIVGGLGILEDANHNTARVAGLIPETMERQEEELLALVKTWMGRIPFPLDVLIIDEIGKNYSGAGMDTKVVNRSVHGEYNPWDTAPRIQRVYLRGLSNMSYGNAVGLGMADICHRRLLDMIDWRPTAINSLTSGTPAAIRTPISFASDRECLERIATTVGKVDLSQLTMGWIANSLDISRLGLSENLIGGVKGSPELEIVNGPVELPFDDAGDLPQCEEFVAERTAAVPAQL